jgi:hypothetical protein
MSDVAVDVQWGTGLCIWPELQTCTKIYIYLARSRRKEICLVLKSYFEEPNEKDNFVIWEKLIVRPIKLLLALASTIVLDFMSLPNMHVFRSGASSSTRGGVGLSL